MMEVQVAGPVTLTDVRGVTHVIPRGMYCRVILIESEDRGDDGTGWADPDYIWEVSAPYRGRDKKIDWTILSDEDMDEMSGFSFQGIDWDALAQEE